MFGFRIAKTEERKKSVPWYTMGWMFLLVLLFGWSQWGLSSKTKTVNQAKEKLACYFLKYDHTIIPPKVQKHLPKEIQKHANRVTPYVELYYKAGMAREQARQWLSEGSGTRFNTSKPPKGMTCLQYAIRQGQFSQHPKRRLFRKMASISTTTLEGHQKELQRLGQAYLKSRQSHPFYGWGLVASDKNALSWITSTVISPGFLTLAWHLLLLWMLAGFLEAAWGGAIWLGFYWVGGIFGNILLMVLLSGSKQPILGSSLALTTIVGMWAFATLQRPIQVWGHQIIPTQKIPVAPSWMILVGWLGFSLVNTLILGYPIVPYILAQLVCFGLGVGGVATLQYLEWLEEIPKPRAERSLAQQERQRTRPEIRAFKKPETGTKKSMYLKPDLKEMVKHTYEKGQFQEAVDGFRELYKKGQARLEDFEGLFLACEKGNIAPEPDDFLRALRAAAFAKNVEKAQAFYMRFQTKRSQMHWSLREQISLAQELKRAGMYEDTLQELDILLDEGPDGTFFMDAIVIKAETLIAEGKELEQAMQLIYKAELHLQDNPTYKESVGRLRLLLADVDGGSIPEIRQIPKGLGASDMFDSDQDQVGENLLENFDLFEQKLQEAEKTTSADSWNELPSLLLRDKEKEQRFLEEVTNPDSIEDDSFLMGDNDIPVEEMNKPETLETNPNTVLSGSFDRFTGIPDAPVESLNPLTPPPASYAPPMYGSQEMQRLEPHIVDELLGKLSHTTPPAAMEPNIASPHPPSLVQETGSWSSTPIPPTATHSGLQGMSPDALASGVSISSNAQPYRPRLSNALLETLNDGVPSAMPNMVTMPDMSAMQDMSTMQDMSAMPPLGVVYQEAPHGTLQELPMMESFDPGVPVSLYPQAQIQPQMSYTEPPLQHPGNSAPFAHGAILELTEMVKDDDND